MLLVISAMLADAVRSLLVAWDLGPNALFAWKYETTHSVLSEERPDAYVIH